MQTRSKTGHAKLVAALALPAASMLAPSHAHAYGALFSSVDAPATRERAVVVAFRESGLTALTIQSDYRGPSADLALVLPVPASTTLADVHGVDASAIARLERATAPRLVELWERDPCAEGEALARPPSSTPSSDPDPVVIADESGRVGDYEVTLLDAAGSAHLDTWLTEHGMHVPEGTTELARPHLGSHTRLLVARLPRERVRLEDGRAVLPPLRVDLETPEVSVPLAFSRAGLGPAASTIVLVVGRHRYEPVNVRNVFGLTNLDVEPEARDRLGALHDALGGGLFARDANILLATHAERVTDCSACADVARPDASVLGVLGADVLFEGGLATGLGHGGGARTVATITQELSVPSAEGPIQSEVAERVLRRYAAMVRACYELELAARPIDRATQRVELAVAPDGTISRVTTAAARTGLTTEPALDCLRDRAARIQLPSHETSSRLVLSLAWRGRDPDVEAHDGRPLGRAAEDLVVTRFEQRGAIAIDPILTAARPVVGGREVRDELGALESGVHGDHTDALETRYVIRHPWRGPIACESPRRDVWRARERDDDDDALAALTPAPFDARPTSDRALALATLVRTAVPELGLPGHTDGGAGDEPVPTTPTEPVSTTTAGTDPASSAARPEESAGWCSARAGTRTPRPVALLAILLALAAAARRRSTRR